MTICAYCKHDRTLTREHLIPSFMYEQQRQFSKSVIGWNQGAGQMVPGEFKVKDVCAQCNNNTLSELDKHAKHMLERAGILTTNFTQAGAILNYDFDLLARWLLKVSFNSSRMDHMHSHVFEPFIPYIMGQRPTPARSKLSILAYLAAPIQLDVNKREDQGFLALAGGARRFNPFHVRLGHGVNSILDGCTVRINTFGPLVFYMLLFDSHVLPGHAAAAVRRFTKSQPGAVEVTRKHKIVALSTGQMSWRDLYIFQIARVQALKRNS